MGHYASETDEPKEYKTQLDRLIDEQPPWVGLSIQQVIDKAGTSDADWEILLAAGKIIGNLRRQLNLIEKAVKYEGNKFD